MVGRVAADPQNNPAVEGDWTDHHLPPHTRGLEKERERKCASARAPLMKGYPKPPKAAPHSMAYANLLYGNDETEFSKRLHVVPRGYNGVHTIELIRRRRIACRTGPPRVHVRASGAVMRSR